MKNIVVLGAGLAAVPVIRQTMRELVLKNDGYKLIVVAPNTHMHFPISMPRVIVPGQLSEDKIMVSLDKQFKQYPASKFEFVLGEVSSLSTEEKLVKVGDRSINYDYLVIATGASSRDDGMPWKVTGSTEKTKENLNKIREEIKQAQTIVVVGGGPTGVETAGELGSEYGKGKKKEIYLIHSGDHPLGPGTLESVRKQARIELERMNVKLVSNSTVIGSSRDGKDYTIEVKNEKGETKTIKAQAYLPATGVTPNSSFAPAGLLDDKGYFRQTKTLQVEGLDNVFVVGDVGNLEQSKSMKAEAQVGHLIKALPGVILRGEAVPEYKVDPKQMLAVTLGRSKATGQMGDWKLPSIMIWFIKGRTMFSDKVEGWAAGKSMGMATFEK